MPDRKTHIQSYTPNRQQASDPKAPKPGRLLRLILIVLLSGVLVFSFFKLTGYVIDLITNRSSTAEMQALYHTEQSTVDPAAYTKPPIYTAAPTATPSPAPETAAVYATPQPDADKLPSIYSTMEDYAHQSGRFGPLLKKNADVIGWLAIPDLLDQAVMLRDNSYYLRRGFNGHSNANGSLFLQELTSFSGRSRPYTFIVYGHNMKTGEMFGNLRKYTTSSWANQHAVITFDTIYENGVYAVFAAGVYPVDRSDFNIYNLMHDTVSERKVIIDKIRQGSRFYVGLDVQPDDQLLLLVTCTGDDSERFIVAARRLRPDEDVDTLKSRWYR